MAKAKIEKEEETGIINTAQMSMGLAAQRPDFMLDDAELGMDDLTQHIIPPRLKVVQRQSEARFLERFNPCDVILMPQEIAIAQAKLNSNGKPGDESTVFHFVPLFMFAEFCQWNPLEMKGTLDSIRQRSTDPKSALAQKCRNKELWFEPCPENPKLMCRNVEHLNYIVTLVNHPLAGMQLVMSFARAEHRAGSNLAALIKMRKTFVGGVYEAVARLRVNNKGQWFGIDVQNPSEESGVNPFIQDSAQYQAYKETHLKLAKAHRDGLITVRHDDEDILDEAAAGAPATTEY